MDEDPSKTQMEDSMRLFEQIANNEELVHLPIIVFFNKWDIFCKKISSQKENFRKSSVFHDYKGPSGASAAAAHIQRKLLALNKQKARPVTSHVTCAVDNENMSKVLNSIFELILNAALHNAGLFPSHSPRRNRKHTAANGKTT
mmetsp:Transcript_1915/g.3711  ORF Transcript_1915/g.3711 Transcript_1915/m.3711 type:complete len:144 (+) Transcript_1915:1054-1485(+)